MDFVSSISSVMVLPQNHVIVSNPGTKILTIFLAHYPQFTVTIRRCIFRVCGINTHHQRPSDTADLRFNIAGIQDLDRMTSCEMMADNRGVIGARNRGTSRPQYSVLSRKFVAFQRG